ncbi:hypothetical protein LA065_003192 [Vibrio parahaemolyticus]|nr:hypothetical protein [Vibrio parahaemolyticus]
MSMYKVTTELSFNGKSQLSAIQKEMTQVFSEVGLAYKGRKNRSLSVIQGALKDAHQVIYEEVLARAPTIKPEILERESPELRNVHIKSREYTVERSALTKRMRNRGLVARRIITFKEPVSKYVAAVEFGRDESFHLKAGKGANFKVIRLAPMKAQPFLRPAQRAKASEAILTFNTALQKRWLTVLKRLNKVGKT